MDQASSNSSIQGSTTEGTPAWGPMGGNIGEGGFQAAENVPTGSVNSMGGAPYYQQQQQQQYQQPYPQQQQQQYQSNIGGGGIGTMNSGTSNSYGGPGSYASRSAQAYAQYKSGQPSVTVGGAPSGMINNQSQMQNPHNNNNNNNSVGTLPPSHPPPPPPQQLPPPPPSAPGNFAAGSSVQGYSSFAKKPPHGTPASGTAQQPMSPSPYFGGGGPPSGVQPTIASPPYGTTPTPQNTPAVPTQAASSYAARSQQAYATGGTMAAPPPSSSGYFGAAAAQTSMAPSYSQQVPQQPRQPTRPYGGAIGATPTVNSAGGGYAARSAQAYASMSGPQLLQQQQPQQFPPPPSTVVVSNSNNNVPQQPQSYYGSPSYGTQPPRQADVGGGGGYVPSSDQSVSATTIATTPTMAYGGQQQPPPSAYAPTNNQATTPGVYGQASVSNQKQLPGMPQPLPAQAIQQRLLTDATRKVQEHAYYMRQAMDQNNLPSVLERAAYMAGELGVPPHGHQAAAQGVSAPSLSNTGISVKLTPKNYYELYMRALEDMPSFEDYLLGLAAQQHQQQQDSAPSYTGSQYFDPQQQYGMDNNFNKKQPSYTMREIYDCVQYCPRVLSRLYLQISAGSALIRSGEVGPKWVLNDLINCVKCEQNPIRGLFLRNYLLTVLRDKLPDTTTDNNEKEGGGDGQDSSAGILERGTVKDSYEFVMENFMEMNKLWVRLQHLPGDGNTKEVKKRRERERNDLRILVGTNLVRISQLDGVTSKIYGEAILPRVLDHVVMVGDPLSQAYLMDCLVQVFPDEYHIETLPILLNVCPRLRDKVNIRTILQGLMDRLANYLADEELLDESDTNQVKLTLARDSFGMFEECVQKVYNARGPKLTPKEVIRLQTALLQFSLKCYPGNMDQIARCMGACVTALQQANASYDINAPNAASPMPKALDDVAVVELEKLLSIPLESLALRVLELENYSELIVFLPWANRRAVAQTMLEAVDKAGAPPRNLKEIRQLFSIIEPLTRSQSAASSHAYQHHQDPTARATSLMAGLGVGEQNSVPSSFQGDFGDHGNEGPMTPEIEKECALVSKLVHLLDHENTDLVYNMLDIAREQIRRGGKMRASRTLIAVVFASLKLARRIHDPSGGEIVVSPGTDNRDLTTEKKDDAAEGKDEKPSSENAEVDASAVTDAESSGDDVTKDVLAEADTKTDGGSAKEPPTETDTMDNGCTTEEKETATEIETKEKDADAEAAPEVPEPKETEPLADKDGDEQPKDENLAGADEKEDEVHSATETKEDPKGKDEVPLKDVAEKLISARQVFVFVQETIVLIGKASAEVAVKLFIEAALTAANFAVGQDSAMYAPVAYELLSQSYSVYEEGITDSNAQRRSITAMIGALLTCKSLSESDYEGLITKTAQLSAKLVKKPDQCLMVAQCAHLFFPVSGPTYSNPQRALECLQRSLKLADACTASNPSQVFLFVDLLEHYVFFLENKNPSVNAAYVTGLAALVKEYLRNSTDARAVSEARSQYLALVREIQRKKSAEATTELFASVEVDTVGI
ncbi:hypothetical protein ACA910_019679 [Epithemia clementina (nom. ined.)]